MNTYNLNEFKDSLEYQNYIKENNGIGRLRVRTFAAREAIPVSDVKITVSNVIDDNKIIFFEGMTDDSGMTPKIELPVPKLDESNLVKPNSMQYKLEVKYEPAFFSATYDISMYDDICVSQNINIPMMQGEF